MLVTNSLRCCSLRPSIASGLLKLNCAKKLKILCPGSHLSRLCTTSPTTIALASHSSSTATTTSPPFHDPPYLIAFSISAATFSFFSSSDPKILNPASQISSVITSVVPLCFASVGSTVRFVTEKSCSSSYVTHDFLFFLAPPPLPLSPLPLSPLSSSGKYCTKKSKRTAGISRCPLCVESHARRFSAMRSPFFVASRNARMSPRR
mmetsp:Transcript_22936/g.57982  ORF Transcript_22936/g.57982 Transcript_22936/m.57982 type:complete len:206 (-) Transcript_22936:2230-2847(-)